MTPEEQACWDKLAAECAALRSTIDDLTAGEIHTCHDHCQRTACILRRENTALRSREQQLQRALAFWHPGVRVDDVPEAATKRAADDACLLYGLEVADEQSAADLGWVAWVVPGEFARLRSRLAEAETQNRVMWDVASDREARLAEAEALLRVMPGYGLSAYDKERWEKARNAFLAPDSASGNRCAYCGVPDGDGHTGDCQHPALSNQPSSAPAAELSGCSACDGSGYVYRDDLIWLCRECNTGASDQPNERVK